MRRSNLRYGFQFPIKALPLLMLLAAVLLFAGTSTSSGEETPASASSSPNLSSLTKVMSEEQPTPRGFDDVDDAPDFTADFLQFMDPHLIDPNFDWGESWAAAEAAFAERAEGFFSDWQPEPLETIFTHKNLLPLEAFRSFSPGKIIQFGTIHSAGTEWGILLTTAFGGFEVWLAEKESGDFTRWFKTDLGILLSVGFMDCLEISGRIDGDTVYLEYRAWGEDLDAIENDHEKRTLSSQGCSSDASLVFSLHAFLMSIQHAVESDCGAMRDVVNIKTVSEVPKNAFPKSDFDAILQHVVETYPCFELTHAQPEIEVGFTDEIWSQALDFVSYIKGFPFPITGGEDSRSRVYTGKYPFVVCTEKPGQTPYSIRFWDDLPNSAPQDGKFVLRAGSFSHSGHGMDFESFQIAYSKDESGWSITNVQKE